MRIGIEAQRLFRKKKHGMDIVALELIRNLQRMDTQNEYVIFVKPDEDDKIITESANMKIVPLAGGAYPLWEQVALPKAAKQYGCDILHCTGNTAPLFYNVPLVLTLHDIIYMEKSALQLLTEKGSAYQKFGNVYRRMVVPAVLKHCRKIITVSDYEKGVIGNYFGMQQDERLATVYNGVSEHFQPVKDEVAIARVRNAYRLPERYFFFLGNTHPKKNTPGVLQAYADYVAQKGSDIKLVMIDYERHALQALLQELGCPSLIDHIVLTGYVNNKDLPVIYGQSELFLYPSLRESFGIPVIEAMASGCPVITSNTSSMPEVAGEAALLIDPYAPSTITQAMIKITASADVRSSMIDEGLQQAARFSWAQMAAQVLDIYQEIAHTLSIKQPTAKR
jgi:glycosyltransferase involved in cell wall biosynthesis